MLKFLFLILAVLIIFLISTRDLPAQSPDQYDFQFNALRNKAIDESKQIHQHNIRFMRSSSNTFLVRYNPVRLLFGGMMYFYQGVISPQLPSECLYVESCSHFSQSLIMEFGLFKGVFTTSDRLMRCNRVSALDVHPLMIDPQSGRVNESVEIYRFQP